MYFHVFHVYAKYDETKYFVLAQGNPLYSIVKNMCFNYREFDLEDDLVRGDTTYMVFIRQIFHNTV